MLQGFMRRLGFVTRKELVLLEEKLRAMRERREKATQRLAEAAAMTERLQQARRDDAQRYKARIAELESEKERRAGEAQAAAARASQHIASLEEELRKRDAELEAAAREEAPLEQRVVAATVELQAVLESLAVIDVKLDILEGAANVLDRRMRAAGAGLLPRDDA